MYLVCAGILFTACDKTETYTPTTPANNPIGADDLDDIVIPTQFNWSSSTKGRLNVSLDAPGNMITNGAPITLVDGNQNVVDRATIFNNEADFYYIIPQNNAELSVVFPNTGESVVVDQNSSIVLTVGQEDRDLERDSTFFNSGKKGKRFARKAMANLLIAGDFEGITDSDLGFDDDDYDDLRPVGKWYEGNNDGELKNSGGSQVYKSKDNDDWFLLVQSVSSPANANFTASFEYSGNSSRVSGYADYFDANGNHLGYALFSESSGVASLSSTTPANCAFVQLWLRQKKKGHIDNVVLDIINPIVDSDNDGVPDDSDEYPNDASKAYSSYFPSSGYQTLAFEDLWPAKGDFDFNDMVVSNNVVYGLDANNNKVDATFTISLDAVGSGFSNGLAIVFTDANKNFLSQSIISSVSGNASLDPNVTNGIIVFDDVYTAQSVYYQNNGDGPSAPADEFTFTVTFNSNAGSQAIIPDTYIYRTGVRGNEVHLDGFSGTSAADVSLNGSIDDVSGTYNTANGLPWALEIVTAGKDFDHPIEKVDIVVAYPNFQSWAESNGTLNTDWLDNSIIGNIFQ